MDIDWSKYDGQMLRQVDLHGLLPQQEPFVMVGRLCGVSGTGAQTETLVTEDNIFVEDGVMTAPGLLENMAQTHAARLGFINKYILGQDVQTGFIGAIKDAVIQRLPRVGETLLTRVEIVSEVFGMALSEVEISTEKGPVASSQMKIAVK